MTYSLLIIDDHKIVRDGLKSMLLGKPGIQVIAEASSAAEAKARTSDIRPDLVFVDLKLPDAKGSDLIAELKGQWPDARFALLTADPNPTDLKKAKGAGALAFLTKDMNTDEYFAAFDRMIAGQRYISASFADMMLMPEVSLTVREGEVLQAFAAGLSYKEIGAKLGMSPRTVETHKIHLLEKFSVKSVVEMVQEALKQGHLQL